MSLKSFLAARLPKSTRRLWKESRWYRSTIYIMMVSGFLFAVANPPPPPPASASQTTASHTPATPGNWQTMVGGSGMAAAPAGPSMPPSPYGPTAAAQGGRTGAIVAEPQKLEPIRKSTEVEIVEDPRARNDDEF